MRCGAVLALALFSGCRCSPPAEQPRVRVLNLSARLTRARCTAAQPLAVITVEIHNQSTKAPVRVSVDRAAVLESPSHVEQIGLRLDRCLSHLGFGFEPYDGVVAAGQSRELLCKFVPPPDDAVARLSRALVRVDVTVGTRSYQFTSDPVRVETCEPDAGPPATGPAGSAAPAPPGPRRSP